MRSMDRFEPPECGPQEPEPNWDGGVFAACRGREARRELARNRAEQAIDNGETPELDALFIVLGEPPTEVTG